MSCDWLLSFMFVRQESSDVCFSVLEYLVLLLLRKTRHNKQ